MRILLFTGKGGVGKTTVAAATALRCAQRGDRTLLLSTDAAHSLSDALAYPLGPEPAEVNTRLWAAQIDTQRQLELAWRQIHGYVLEMLSRGGVDPVMAEELTVLPGIDEVLALLAVREYAASDAWDVLVLDCAPTAETLRLLALPEALGWYLRKVFPVQRRLARGIRPLALALGRGDALPPDDVFAALLTLNDELAQVHALLVDPQRTSVRLVLTPEAMVLAETRRTHTALALYGYRVDSVIANKVFPDGGDELRRGWAKAQQARLSEIRTSFGQLPLREVSYRRAEPVGAAELALVASELYGTYTASGRGRAGQDPLVCNSVEPSMQVVERSGEYHLEIPLPFASTTDVDAVRVGEDLVMTVGAHRRVLALPSLLRRCTVVGGEVREGVLVVRFAPDPALWPASSSAPSSAGAPAVGVQ